MATNPDPMRDRPRPALRFPSRPAIRGTWTFRKVEPVHLKLTLTLPPDADEATAGAVMAKLGELVAELSAADVTAGGKGFRVDIGRSGLRPGPAVELVLVPNHLRGAVERLKRAADLLARSAGGPVVVRVATDADPETPLYQTAA
ncbi:MAG: hypothetical protein K2X87_33965 [Gemmataceae bacterium]|nr:hypothetical protein [Gemmataceae bacterium]